MGVAEVGMKGNTETMNYNNKMSMPTREQDEEEERRDNEEEENDKKEIEEKLAWLPKMTNEERIRETVGKHGSVRWGPRWYFEQQVLYDEGYMHKSLARHQRKMERIMRKKARGDTLSREENGLTEGAFAMQMAKEIVEKRAEAEKAASASTST
jgi:hypothetical protein